MLVAAGYSNDEIAARLGIDFSTVAEHVREAIERLVARERGSERVPRLPKRQAAGPHQARKRQADSVDGAAFEPEDHGLTPRERQVAALIRDGKRDADVAHALGISVRTGQVHARAVLKKLGLRSRRQLQKRKVIP